MRSRGLTAVAAATLAVALMLPAVALMLPAVAAAQGTATSNPFSPGLPVTPAPTPTAPTATTPTTTTTSTSGGGLSGADAVAIAIGAIALIAGISLYIWRDARRRAPVRHHMASAEEGGRAGTKARPKPRKLSPAERRRRKRGRAR
jgi:hypothetical protein